jgi:hypothetical protein
MGTKGELVAMGSGLFSSNPDKDEDDVSPSL